MAKAINHFLAVYVGAEDQNAGRVESRMWDMLRYDRCHPLHNADRFEAMGFVILIQPYVKDMKGGFTDGRWDSHGFRIRFTEMSDTRHIPFKLEERCREYAEKVKRIAELPR